MTAVSVVRRTALAVASVVLLLGAPAVAAARPVGTTAPAVPDSTVHNGRIAFSTGYVNDNPQLAGQSQVFTVNSDGTGLRQLTDVRRPVEAADPVWSPDGRRIVYVTNPAGDYEIWEMRAGGTGKHLLARTTKGWQYVDPGWSPDGTHLVVSRCDDSLGFPAQCEIDVMRADGSHRRRIAGGDHRFDSDPVYSPDGRTIAFDSDRAGYESAVWLVGRDGAGIRRVTPATLDAFWPAWSPLGGRLLVTSHASVPGSQVFVMDSDGTHLRQLTHFTGGHQGFFASYAPDGRRILLVSDLKRAVQGPYGDLYTMRPDGTDLTRITHTEPLVVVSNWGIRPRVGREFVVRSSS